MLSLTRKTDYALVALAALAADPGSSRSARELAVDLRLPLPALRNILKQLARAGLVRGTHGPRGGYVLGRGASEITVEAVAEAIERPARLVPCCTPHTGPEGPGCHLEGSCLIKGAVRRLHERIVEFLGDVTVSDLLQAGRPVRVGEGRTTEVRA